MPQNADNCTTGFLHCLPVASSFRRELTNSMLGRVVDRFLFFLNNGCSEDDVALSAAAHSARCLLYLSMHKAISKDSFYISAERPLNENLPQR